VTNHHGFQPASRAANAAKSAPELINVLQANNRFAATRWSASAPPINGDTSAQSGGTTKTIATQPASSRAFRIFVSAGNQNPGVIPCKKNTIQSHPKTDPGLFLISDSPCTRGN
jgi:hypothetical protein